MLSDYQLKIADIYNILINNVKKLVPNFFDKEKQVNYFEKKNEFEFNPQKRIEAGKYGDNDGKALYYLMNNTVYGKIMENLKNITDNYLTLVRNKKDYLKCKASYILHKIFDNDLVAIRKSKVISTLNKTCIHWEVHIRIMQSINVRILL